MHEKISCTEARQMDLVDYLDFLGHHPQRISRSDYWYLSPLRQERTASFKVDRRLNLWYDHGLGKGGTLIDFGILYFNCSVGELLRRLSTGLPAPASLAKTSLPLPAEKAEKNGAIRILSATAITSLPLKHYLAARKIDETLAARYCRQIHFTLYGKAHLAIGFPNNSGGYELRNDYFKGSSSPKDITTLGSSTGTISVFEGFFSFLSYLQLQGGGRLPQTGFLVLNSLALWQRALPSMEAHRRVHLYLDRDEAGRKATQKALAQDLRYQDKSHTYRHFKDLNELLVAGKGLRALQQRPGRSC